MAVNEEDRVKYIVFRIIEESPEHSVFFLSDFAEITSLETIRKVLAHACEADMLSHVSHGVYVKPMMSRSGEVPVPLAVQPSDMLIAPMWVQRIIRNMINANQYETLATA